MLFVVLIENGWLWDVSPRYGSFEVILGELELGLKEFDGFIWLLKR